MPGRWQHRDRFAILQIGLGAGLDFLATWAAWQNDMLRCERLHFVVLEPSPPDCIALQQTLDTLALDPLLQELAQHLCAQWPTLLSGTQRLEFAAGRVVLTLVFGELLLTLPTLAMRADAFYLDAPVDPNSYVLVDPLGGNPVAEVGTVEGPFLLRGLTRVAAQHATLVATTLHAELRKRLREYGFEITAVHDDHDNGGRVVASFAPRFSSQTPRAACTFFRTLPPRGARRDRNRCWPGWLRAGRTTRRTRVASHSD